MLHGTFGSSDSKLTVRLEGIRNISQGEVLQLSIEPKNVHVFDTIPVKDSNHDDVW